MLDMAVLVGSCRGQGDANLVIVGVTFQAMIALESRHQMIQISSPVIFFFKASLAESHPFYAKKHYSLQLS